ncbi:MAG: hypothetical protein V8S24_14420 [Gordonibacter pamelaeae]
MENAPLQMLCRCPCRCSSATPEAPQKARLATCVTWRGMRTTSSGPTYRRHVSPPILLPPRWHRSPFSR